jgi:hypothetical protein
MLCKVSGCHAAQVALSGVLCSDMETIKRQSCGIAVSAVRTVARVTAASYMGPKKILPAEHTSRDSERQTLLEKTYTFYL